MVKEGCILSSPAQVVQWAGRALLQVVSMFIRQMPASLQVQVDSTKFLDSITYVNSEGDRVSLPAWPLGPGYQSTAEPADDDDFKPDSASEKRLQLIEVWENWKKKLIKYMPFTVYKMAHSSKAKKAASARDIPGKLVYIRCAYLLTLIS